MRWREVINGIEPLGTGSGSLPQNGICRRFAHIRESFEFENDRCWFTVSNLTRLIRQHWRYRVAIDVTQHTINPFSAPVLGNKTKVFVFLNGTCNSVYGQGMPSVEIIRFMSDVS